MIGIQDDDFVALEYIGGPYDGGSIWEELLVYGLAVEYDGPTTHVYAREGNALIYRGTR